jgi:phosphoribosylaminoimidazole-succinocarboxamide synthase
LAEIGIRLADTKFELGRIDGEVVLIDEALTPDSSRFWPDDEYRTGISPPSFDKQILRDHLETLDWNKEYPPPTLEPAVLARVGRRYLEICERITGSLPIGVS